TVDDDAFLFDGIGQLSLGLADAVLRVHLHDVHVCADVEIHVQRQLAVVAVVGLDIKQFIDAVDFRFDGRGDGFHDGLGCCAPISGCDLDQRGTDGRVLGNRQPFEADQTNDDREDGDDDRDNRTADEKISHGYSLVWLVSVLSSGAWAVCAISSAVIGLTTAPSRTFCNPSITMRSPDLRPSGTTTFSPTCPPTWTPRCVALLSGPMTHTKFLPCNSTIARCGTRMLLARAPRSTRMRANMPGRSCFRSLGN